MKWIKYEYVCGTDADGGEILVKKRVGYSDENLTIAQAEAYNGEYTIEDDGKEYQNTSTFPGDADMAGHKIKNLGYATDDTDAVNLAKAREIVALAIADKTQLMPEYVGSLDECVDTEKVYVLPDGYIYAYLGKVVKGDSYTNLVPTSIDTDGTIYNVTGYKENVRLSSSGGISGNAQAGSVATGFMQWKYPKKVCFKGATWLGAPNGHYYICFYKSDKTFVNVLSRDMVTGNNTGGCVVTYDATTDVTTFDFSNATNDWWNTVAANSAYIRLNAYGSGADLIVTVDEEIADAEDVVVYSWTNTGLPFVPADYEDRIVALEEKSAQLDEDVEQLEGQVEDIINGPLKGKTIAVLGDSISSVAYTVPNYWQLIAEKTGCTFLDYGVSGSCFAVRSGSTTSFVERAANMAAADAVLVMGGTNDAGKNILLGEWASTDNTTLYGALNALITLLRTNYPGKPIIFCTPIKSMYEKDSGFPKTMADLNSAAASTNLELWHCVLAIQAKCAVHGIPVIDLYNASGIGSQSSVFFRENDKLHPSALGECRIANMVQPVLEHQFLHTL